MKIRFFFLLICFLSAGYSWRLHAKIVLPAMFTDNMVLQRQTEVAFWGTATPRCTVTIKTSWNNKEYLVNSSDKGEWRTRISTPQAGGPYYIIVSDETSIRLDNVLIGEVWLCAGQSNMEMPIGSWGKINNYEAEIRLAQCPEIRVLHVERAASLSPLSDLKKVRKGTWQVCLPEFAANFSAVAYFFAKNLHRHLNVPIGVITASWGGTIAESWISKEAITRITDLESREKDTLKEYSVDRDGPNVHSVLFNAMIHPIIPYTVKGIIWYQGEYNCARAEQYKDIFPLLITDWRKQWKQTLPFYFVQLPNFGERNEEPTGAQWAELREAQFETLCMANTGMAVTIELGEAKNVHPKRKKEVGERLALIARAKTYGEDVVYSGPLYNSYIIEDNRVRIKFDHVDGGLKIKGGDSIKGFSIAGPDHKFYWADAEIDGEEVVVSSPNVPYPLAVRYAWAANPECNLYNGADLPASPFRTDHWK